MYYRISKNEKILFFGKKIAQVWAVTLIWFCFQNTRVATYKLMWQYMSAKEPSVFVSDMEEGIERVREANGKYAFLLESVYNEYYNNKKPCDTMKVGTVLNRNHYGIATSKYSPLR